MNELERRVFHELEPGSALPSESELSSELNVSRLTVREAVKSLQARGLIEVSHGRRPVVARLSATAVMDFFTASIRNDPRNLLDMLDVRRALETYIASLAARRVSRTASSAMADALSAMRESVDDPEAFDLADVRFHEGLATASGNQILTFLIEAMAEPLRAGRVLSRRGHLARRRPLQQVIDEHARIYESVMAGDSNGAAAAMEEHLTQTERSLRRTLEVPQADGELVQP